jgi:hypothetical protein
MTKVIVDPGICGFTVTVSVKKDKDRNMQISIDTDCDMVQDMHGDISLLSFRDSLTGYNKNPVLRSAAKHLKHVACPVPSAILKAIEVEAGACLPKDAHIVFLKKKALPG